MPDHDASTTGRPGWVRSLQWAATGAWVALWTIGGIGSGLDPTNENTLFVGAALAVGFGLVPVLPFWVRWWREGRHDRARRQAAEEAVARHRDTERERARLARLPDHLRDDWRRLEHAHDLVEGFAAQGWIEPVAVTEVADLVARLERLLAADRATDELGGRRSDSLEQQVRDLTDLLVALADEAVEHQATLTSDDPVPATLAEARERLTATREAYRELPSPGSGQEPRQYP